MPGKGGRGTDRVAWGEGAGGGALVLAGTCVVSGALVAHAAEEVCVAARRSAEKMLTVRRAGGRGSGAASTSAPSAAPGNQVWRGRRGRRGRFEGHSQHLLECGACVRPTARIASGEAMLDQNCPMSHCLSPHMQAAGKASKAVADGEEDEEDEDWSMGGKKGGKGGKGRGGGKVRCDCALYLPCSAL